MEWKDAEKQWRIKWVEPQWINENSEGFKAKDPKFEFLVPCFLYCYSRIRPAAWKEIVIYEWDKRIRKTYPILPLVTALLVKRFTEYNGMYKDMPVKDLFIMQWLAFHKDSYYHKQRKQNHPTFFRWETAPEVFCLTLQDKNIKHINNVSFWKYTQYITKSFFRECLAKVFKSVQDAWTSIPPYESWYRMSEEYENILRFFTDWAEAFFSDLRIGKDYLEINDEEHKKELENSRPYWKIQRTITLLLNGVYDEDYEKTEYEFENTIETPEFYQARNLLYERDGERIDKRLYWSDDEKYRYEVE